MLLRPAPHNMRLALPLPTISRQAHSERVGHCALSFLPWVHAGRVTQSVNQTTQRLTTCAAILSRICLPQKSTPQNNMQRNFGAMLTLHARKQPKVESDLSEVSGARTTTAGLVANDSGLPCTFWCSYRALKGDTSVLPSLP